MAQWLRACAVLQKKRLGSPAPHIGSQPLETLLSLFLSCLTAYLDTRQTYCTYIYAGKIIHT